VSEALFARAGDTWTPSAHAVGPWDPAQLHGGAPSALLVDAAQALAPELQVVRASFDFLAPVPLAPLELGVRVVKPGRRVVLVEGELRTDGRTVMAARVMLMRRGAPIALPPGAGFGDGLPCAGPAGSVPVAFPLAAAEDAAAFHRTGMEIRFADGTGYGSGHAYAWFRLAHPLVAGVEPAPAARAVAAADFANGVSHAVGFETHVFVNADLTVTLVRDPVGPWVLLDARTRLDPQGIGWASAVLHDERGPIGFSQQSLFVAER
jgi:Thioesterase-like superfamily